MQTNEYYYARGYFDGRTYGAEDLGWIEEGFAFGPSRRDMVNEALQAYRAGYDIGVSDYCELDAAEQWAQRAASALASASWGTDEDYGGLGGEDW